MAYGEDKSQAPNTRVVPMAEFHRLLLPFLSMVFCLRTVEGCACASAHVRARRGFTVDPYQAILSTSLIFEH